MKTKIFPAVLVRIIFLMFLSHNIFAQPQIWESSWGIGFGGTYPRLMGITTPMISEDENFGFYLDLNRNFNENLSARFRPSFLHMESSYYQDSDQKIVKTNLLSGSVDFLYEIFPCSYISPYVLTGFGFQVFRPTGAPSKKIDKTHFRYQYDLGVGLKIYLSEYWKLNTEINYLTSSHNYLDGNIQKNELKGLFKTNGDSYMTFSLGVNWYFETGEKSNICENPSGLRENPNQIIEHNTYITNNYGSEPKEIIKKEIEQVEKIILFGVNFEFDKSTFLPESYPILKHLLTVLQNHPEINIEIQGHTDNYGTDLYNIGLSQRRADAVKNYLIENGIDSKRLIATGLGEGYPIADNNSSRGRAFNRRIEIKITNEEKINIPLLKQSKESIILDTIVKHEQNLIAKSNKLGEKLIFTNIHFNANSDIISESSKHILNDIKEILSKIPDFDVEIQGYTDNDGDEFSNQILSEKRAISVKNYLVQKGITVHRLTTAGFGESKPISDNSTQEGKAKNRRIEFVIIK
ncbi:MAG: OmpA family protein [Ignavibacteriales bacterium]|nr:OmpA family protein [Ignavibacteriales bacterium]